MSLTAEQIEVRRGKVMASDVAAYLGFNPHASAFQAWALNLGHETFEGNDATDAGNFLEKGLLKLAAHKLEKKFLWWPNPGTVFCRGYSWAGCTPDGIFTDGEGIQIKVHGFHQTRHFDGMPGERGEWDNDLIPEWHHLQCQWEMMVCERSWITIERSNPQSWWLGCHFGGGDFRLYHLKRDDDLITMMVEGARKFWLKHLNPDGPQEPPPLDGSDSTGEYLRRAYPEHNGIMLPATDEGLAWAERYQEAGNREREYQTAKKEAAHHLIQSVGEAEGMEGVCTYRKTNSKPKTDFEALAKSYISWRKRAPKFTATPEGYRRINITREP